jgi:Flp pilus assembly pilin Flp
VSEQQIDLTEECGQTFAEYALVIALISVALIVSLTFLSNQISGLFSHIGDLL